MADKKKMSVAEILAAARKMDSAGGAEQAEPVESTAPAAATEQQSEAAREPAPAEPKPAPASKPAAKAPAGGGRPSVAEMLAMARGEKEAGAKKESPKPAAKPATPKPAAATTPKPAAKAPASAKQPSAGPLDTASILAAARKADKPGPMSKAEAAKRKAVDGTPAPPVKKKIEAPPMPVKPAYAQRPGPAPRPTPSPRPTRAAAPAEPDRRGFLMTGWVGLGTVGALWALATARFMYPNVLREPPSQFKVGFPGDFSPGTVEEKFKAQFGIWVVNTEYNGETQLFALKSVCTHLGCTPNWLEAEQKFKCPCHGSGFYKDGINFEGPAPRPLERYAIRVADDGQVEIDKSRTFQEEMGAWADPASFIPV